MITLPLYHPEQPDEEIPGYDGLPPLDTEDEAVPSEAISTAESSSSDSRLTLPDLILGCATFGYGIYATSEQVRSALPLRVVRLALASGMTAFDMAPWYHPSETILGNCLRALAPDWPRGRYQLLTKVGKYGPGREGHTFEPKSVRMSVERSLRRLGTDYLDVVYLHDIEFRSSLPYPAGNPLLALEPPHAETYGLSPAQMRPIGEGDEEILAGFAELRQLQSEGKVKYVGLAGYPLPLLLRFARLILHTTGTPVDIVQTYAHQTLATQALSGFLQAFEEAQVGLVTNGSPLAMGLLTKGGGPDWHPARNTPLDAAVSEAVTLCEREGVKIEDVATDFGFREIRGKNGKVPAVVGCKNLEEVHMNLRSFGRAQIREGKEMEVAEKVLELMEERGVRNWSLAERDAMIL